MPTSNPATQASIGRKDISELIILGIDSAHSYQAVCPPLEIWGGMKLRGAPIILGYGFFVFICFVVCFIVDKIDYINDSTKIGAHVYKTTTSARVPWPLRLR